MSWINFTYVHCVFVWVSYVTKIIFCHCMWDKKVSNTTVISETKSNVSVRKLGAILKTVRFKEWESTRWHSVREEHARKKTFRHSMEFQWGHENYPGLTLLIILPPKSHGRMASWFFKNYISILPSICLFLIFSYKRGKNYNLFTNYKL